MASAAAPLVKERAGEQEGMASYGAADASKDAVDTDKGAASSMLPALIAEFVGTFLLVFTVGCCVLTNTGEAGANWNPTAIASVLMVLIYALGPVSGGNFNPAVSVALALTGNLPRNKAGLYCLVQIVAGICAGFGYCRLFGGEIVVGPNMPYTWLEAGFSEAFYTFVLCFVVLNCAASKKNNPSDDGNQFFALAIAFVIVAGGYAVGSISGACFNPAVAMGLDVSFHRPGKPYGYSWAYAGFQLLGAAMAVVVYKIVRPTECGIDEPSMLSKLVSEFVGTGVLVMTVGLNVINRSHATAWSAAAALMVMIYSLGNISGAHFNPAVTLSIVIRGKCDAVLGCLYVLEQLGAAFIVGIIVKIFHHRGPHASEKFLLAPGAHHTAMEAAASELIFTFVLAFVVLSVATVTPPPSKTKQNFFFGLAISACVTAGGFAIGSVSGGELNPAVALGIAVQSKFVGAEFLALFCGAEFVGGILAVGVFAATRPGEMRAAKAEVNPSEP